MIKPDAKDALYIVGLVLVLAGATAYDWRIAMVAGGTILLLTAVASVRGK